MPSNLAYGPSQIISLIVTAYIWLIIIRVLLSWVSPNSRAKAMIMLASVTDPALNLARRVCPLVLGGLDFSPIILILALQLIGNILSVSLLLAASNQPFSLLLPVLLLQILRLVKSIAFFLIILMVARIILSLVNASRYNPIVMAIYGITEPLLAPLRRWFPDGPRGLDVKALIFLIGLIIVNNFIIDGLITIIIKKYLLFM